MPTETVLSWWTLTQIVLGAGISSAIVSEISQAYRERQKNKEEIRRSANYAAISIATTLEAFAINCADAIGISEVEDAAPPKFPEIKNYANDIEWKSLSLPLASRAFSIVIEISSSEFGYQFISREIPESALDDFRGEVSKCGNKAWKLAADFRKFYDIPRLDMDTAWVEEILEKYKKSRANLSCIFFSQLATILNERLSSPPHHPPAPNSPACSPATSA